MDYETAKRRLENHANLPDTGLPIADSFAGSLWLADRGEADLSFVDHAADVLACLQAVNTAVNGPDPASTVGPSPDGRIPLEIAYTVSGIVCSGIRWHRSWSQNQRFTATELCALETAVHKIAYAWDQVLAGDISDLLEGFDFPD